jgi:hypothetical protein
MRHVMPHNPEQVLIYHITDVANVPSIIADQALHSDAVMAKRNPEIIGYNHIKQRRLKEIPVPCCQWRKVGEFVPFYFCPRSPMLFTLNKGATGRPEGCQGSVVHLVSTMAAGIATGHPWAVSSGNAGAFHTTFACKVEALDGLDWEAIRATQWQGKQHQKSAEFLVADSFPWSAVHLIGCQNSKIEDKVRALLSNVAHKPPIEIKKNWYY